MKAFLKRVLPLRYHEPILRILDTISLFSINIFYQVFFIDTHTAASPKEFAPAKAFLCTNRYRLAGAGIGLTKNEKELLRLRNSHAGQRAFILGNGPSLNKCDLLALRSECTFGVNSIFLNYARMNFHPTYYVVEDTFVAEDRAEQINHYRGPDIKFFGNYLRYCLRDAPDIAWLNVRLNYEEYAGFPHFSANAARMVWVGGTVSYLCMQLAYYMGFSDVYLIGFDHSYEVPDDARLDASRRQITSASDDPNHFDPSYFGKGYRWHEPQVERMEMAYARARQTFEADNRRILNATVGGRLEVFERIDYADLFGSESGPRKVTPPS